MFSRQSQSLRFFRTADWDLLRSDVHTFLKLHTVILCAIAIHICTNVDYTVYSHGRKFEYGILSFRWRVKLLFVQVIFVHKLRLLCAISVLHANCPHVVLFLHVGANDIQIITSDFQLGFVARFMGVKSKWIFCFDFEQCFHIAYMLIFNNASQATCFNCHRLKISISSSLMRYTWLHDVRNWLFLKHVFVICYMRFIENERRMQ